MTSKMRAWEDFLLLQEKELGKETVRKWLRTLKVLRFDACNLYLEAEDSFRATWFEEHLRHKLETGLLNNGGKPIKVHLSVVALEPKEEKKWKKKEFGSKTAPFEIVFDDLDPKCHFNQFISSQGTLLGYKLLAESCRLDPKTLAKVEKGSDSFSFNPIYLFGRKGTGKTHLLMAAAFALKEEGKNVVFVRAETFTEHVVAAIRAGEMQAFRKIYRHADVLLIDDIEIFSRKNATQEEFFHTFNALHVEGKQIILTASCPPSELKFIEPRLISRFEWGIVIPLQPLGPLEMKQLLLNRCKETETELSSEVIGFLLETFSGNTKTLMRAFDALLLRTHLNRNTGDSKPPTVESLKQLLSDLIADEERAQLTPSKIVRSVAEHYGIRIDDILSKSQAREYSLPRQIAMHLCRSHLQLPYMKIGDIFARDHSTVMASCNQIQKGIEEKDQEITHSLTSIIKKFE